jgi:pyrroloquinoline quinone (PQQ) biosynthesis protein C
METSMTSSAPDLPRLKRSARVTGNNGTVVIQHHRDEITLDGAGARLFSLLQPIADGRTSIDSIAAKVSEKPARVRALLDQLEKAGVIAYASKQNDGELMSGLEFHKLHRESCAYWLEPIYSHPFWERVVNGTASRAQVVGFAFEKYHYIEGAFEHMGIAAANATPEMMPHLARHFIEEYTHGDIYRRGLRSLFPDELILHSQPLPSTRALINFLSESAQRSSFAYYSGNELLQLTENTEDVSDGAGSAVNEFYDAMIKHYPYTAPLVDSFIAHTKADQKLGHADAFLEMCKSVPPMNRREVNDALNVAKDMAEHLMLFMDGIDTFYASFPNLPRVPCDLLSE